MNPKRVQSLRRELLALRKAPHGISSSELIRLAKKVGRKLDSRGKEPTYVRKRDPALSPPLSIPGHRELKAGTAKSVIDALLDDLDEWDIYYLEVDDET